MQLRRGDVLDGAMAILDEYGLGDLTMRELATSLGVQPGARHGLPQQTDPARRDGRSHPRRPRRTATADTGTGALTELTGSAAHCSPTATAPNWSPRRVALCRDSFYGRTTRGPSARTPTHRLRATALCPRPHRRRAVTSPTRRTRRAHPRADRPRYGTDDDLLDGDPAIRFDFGLTLFVDGSVAASPNTHRPDRLRICRSAAVRFFTVTPPWTLEQITAAHQASMSAARRLSSAWSDTGYSEPSIWDAAPR